MKKILSFLMITVLALTCMVMPAFAAEGATVSVSKETVDFGGTVTLEVSISETTLATYGMSVEYDSAALKLTAIEKGEATSADSFFVANAESGKLSGTDVVDYTANGVLFTLTFEVLTSTAGTYPVTINVDNVATADTTLVTVSSVAGEVVVECAHEWEWVIDKEATEAETGLKHEECKKCGAIRNEGTVIDKVLPPVPPTGDVIVAVGMIALVACAGVCVTKRRRTN